MRRIYVADILIGVLGGILLSYLFSASGIQIPNTPWLLMIPIVLTVLLAILLVRRFKTREDILRTRWVDERVIAITDKSARNGLVATYLALLVTLLYTGTSDEKFVLDAKLLLIVIAAGLFVFCVSYYSYYYRSD